MSHETTPQTVNKSLDMDPEKMLGESGIEAPIVTPLPDPVKEAENLTAEIPEANLDASISDAAKTYDGFDPSIHATNKDGTPKFRADGKTFALKRGRKPGDHIPSPLPDAVSGDVAQSASNIDMSKPSAAPVPPKVDYTGLGKVYAGLFVSAGVGLIGEEWAPQDNDERKNLETAFAMYAKSTNAVDLPPGWALVFALGIYSAKRLPHPNTRGKLEKLKDKAKLIILWLKTKRG